MPASYSQDVPGTLRPGQIEKQFEKRPRPKADQPSAVQVDKVPLPEPPAEMFEQKFQLTKLSFDGATVFDQDELLEESGAQTGVESSIGDLYVYANNLTRYYRSKGYVLARVIVPEQSIQDGAAALRVFEGYIDRIEYSAEGHVPGDRIKGMLDRILEVRPVNISDLERYLLLVNDLDGVFASGTLVQGSELGASTLVVGLNFYKFDVGAGADNRASEAFGTYRFRLEGDINSVFGGYQTAGIFASLNKELKFLRLAYDQPIGTDGASAFVIGTITRSEPELAALVDPLATDSDRLIFGIEYPIHRSRSSNLAIRSTFTLHHDETEFANIKLSENKVRPLRLGIRYDLYDKYRGVNLVDFEVSKGLPILGASDSDFDETSPPNADFNFTKLNWYLARLQYFGGSGWSMLLAFEGQYAFDVLPTSEGYAWGGEFIGRAYDPSELFGDSGLGVKAELRYLQDYNGFFKRLEPYLFADAGRSDRRDPAPGVDNRESASSAGAGLRFDFAGGFTGYLEVAKPLTKEVNLEGNKDARVFGAISWRFF